MHIRSRKFTFLVTFVVCTMMLATSLYWFRASTLKALLSATSSCNTVTPADVERKLGHLKALRRLCMVGDDEYRSWSVAGYRSMRDKYMTVGNLPNALQMNKKILSRKPKDMNALFVGYRLACLTERYKDALRMAQTMEYVVANPDPTSPYVWSMQHGILAAVLQTHAYRLMGDVENALNCFDRAMAKVTALRNDNEGLSRQWRILATWEYFRLESVASKPSFESRLSALPLSWMSANAADLQAVKKLAESIEDSGAPLETQTSNHAVVGSFKHLGFDGEF